MPKYIKPKWDIFKGKKNLTQNLAFWPIDRIIQFTFSDSIIVVGDFGTSDIAVIHFLFIFSIDLLLNGAATIVAQLIDVVPLY